MKQCECGGIVEPTIQVGKELIKFYDYCESCGTVTGEYVVEPQEEVNSVEDQCNPI